MCLYMDPKILDVFASIHIETIRIRVRNAENVSVRNSTQDGVVPANCNFLNINYMWRIEKREKKKEDLSVKWKE